MNYILLPVHNRRDTSVSFARALAQQSAGDFHLLLLDDGSHDGTADAVTAVLPHCTTVLRGTGKWWWGGALDRGWRWLSAQGLCDDDTVVICNDDVDLPDDFLKDGYDLLAQNPRALVVAKAKDAETGNVSETCYAIDFAHCRVALVSPGQTAMCAPTRGLFVRWADMRRVGGFHPYLLPHYLSDLEWTLRAHEHGMTIVRDDRLWLVQHREKTGFHGISDLRFFQRLQRIFSNKYAVNPLHWAAFIVLGFPARYWLPAFARVGLWTAGAVLGR